MAAAGAITAAAAAAAGATSAAAGVAAAAAGEITATAAGAGHLTSGESVEGAADLAASKTVSPQVSEAWREKLQGKFWLLVARIRCFWRLMLHFDAVWARVLACLDK